MAYMETTNYFKPSRSAIENVVSKALWGVVEYLVNY